MEKLQWFKFAPSDYMMGKIQRCPEITQARFIRLCCLYWNKSCELLVEDAEIEIDKEHLDILVSKRIISVNNEYVNISFLDEQIAEIKDESKDRSYSGSVGNLKRWHPEIYKKFSMKEISLEDALRLSKEIAHQSHPDSYPMANQSHPDCTPIATQSQSIAEKIRRDKIREDKIREDDIILKKPKIKNPTQEEVVSFFVENGYKESSAIKAYNYYNDGQWTDSNGKKVINWKQKMRIVWFKEENLIKENPNTGEYKKASELSAQENIKRLNIAF